MRKETLAALALAALVSRFSAGEEAGQDPVEAFLQPGIKASVPLQEIVRGGPPVDGIPALTNSRRVSAAAADSFLAPDDEVLGVVVNGKAAAYPLRLLVWHEIVNDELGGVPVAVSHCPMSRSGLAFDRRVKGKALEFGVSGLIHKNDLIMYDRETRSLWSHVRAEAIAGPSTGRSLARLPAVYSTWREWRQAHPDTEAAGFDTGYPRDYTEDPYIAYRLVGLIYPPARRDGRLPEKEPVIGVLRGSKALAVPVALVDARGTVEAKLGRERITFKRLEGVRAYLKDGAEIPGTPVFWGVWYDFHPNTGLVKP